MAQHSPARPSATSAAARAVRTYAARCREVLPEGFEVRSYAGLWLLLATLGPVTSGRERAELEDALGVSVEEAAALAAELLGERRDDLDAAVAGWLRDDSMLAGKLPVRLDALPDQAGLDAWARTSTRGRIEAFPLTLVPETVLVLASALVTETLWREPLTVRDDRLLLDEEGLLAEIMQEAIALGAQIDHVGDGHDRLLLVVGDADAARIQGHFERKIK